MARIRIVSARAGGLLPLLAREIGEARERKEHVILLVPEQYTIQAERELVERLRLPGLLDVEVLSPRRLGTRIRDLGGSPDAEPLDSRGRVMAIGRALLMLQPEKPESPQENELQFYGTVARRPSLAERISVLLEDLGRAGFTPETLRAHAATADRRDIRQKEHDLALIWETYEQLIGGHFVDELAQQEDLARRVVPSGALTGVRLYVYGFDMLQATLAELLCQAATVAASVTVTMVMDEQTATDGHIFLAQRGTVEELAARAREHGLEECLYERVTDPVQDERPEALKLLERSLFSRGVTKGKKINEPQDRETDAPKAPKPDVPQDCVTIMAASDPYDEADRAARVLRGWHEGSGPDDPGLPWQDMAVALALPEPLSGILSVTLRAAGIPFYLTKKDSIRRHGLCCLLLSCTRAAVLGYAQKDVLDAARSGFSPLDEDEAMTLENYALENGIDHGRWREPFHRGDPARVEEAEPLRQRLMEPIVALHDELKQAKDAAESTVALYRLLERCEAYQKLTAQEKRLLDMHMPAEAAADRQAWKVVIGLLDQIHALLGSQRAVMDQLPVLLEAGLESVDISPLPPEPGQVTIGEAGHMMTGRVKRLLLMGMQDGVTASMLESLISDEERASLTGYIKRSVGLTQQQQSAIRLSDFYRTITLPTQELVISYSQSGADGKSQRASTLVDAVRALLPDCRGAGRQPSSAGIPTDGLLLSPEMALEAVALRLRRAADDLEAARDGREPEDLLGEDGRAAIVWLLRDPAWHDRMRQVLESVGIEVKAAPLSYDLARRLWQKHDLSVSRLETYARCPYRYFVQYGLQPTERRPFAFGSDELGSFFHKVLEDFTREAMTLPSFPELDDDQIAALVQKTVDAYEETWRDGPLDMDAVSRNEKEEHIRRIRSAVGTFCRQAARSAFRTVAVEQRFGMGEGSLPALVLETIVPEGEEDLEPRRFALSGIIDRVDSFTDSAGKTWIRVVDNKSGKKELDPEEIWSGTQLQLPLYLDAAQRGMKDTETAGCFYFQLKDPLVKADLEKQKDEQALAEKAREERDKALRLNGLVVAEPEVVSAMNADEEHPVIGSVFKQDGTLTANAKACSREDLRGMLRFCEGKASRMAGEIDAGRIDIAPRQAKSEREDDCGYCPYAAVCGLDKRLRGEVERAPEDTEKGMALVSRMAREAEET